MIIKILPVEALRSAAGWYAGSLCEVKDETGEVRVEPYDRQSEYMDTEAEAQQRVDHLMEGEIA